MGPTQSRLIENVNINHPHFKNAEVIMYDDVQYIKTKMVLHNVRAFEQWQKAQSKVEQMDGTYLLLPVDHKVEKGAFCGPSAILSILYENYPIILADEIENRNGYEEYFQEVEVWYLLHILISTSSSFHEKNMKLGDVRPQNIFIEKNGQVKVANVYSWPSMDTNYYKSLAENQVTYLAPEQLQEISTKSSKSSVDPYKAQSFSIGLTLLGSMLLVDCLKLYNLTNYTFDTKQLQNLIGRLNAEKLYSPFLRKIVSGLVDLNPKTRTSSRQVYEMVRPYIYNMENLIEFQPQSNQKTEVVTSSFNNTDPRPYKTQDNILYNQEAANTQIKYNYASNLPLYTPGKYNTTVQQVSYLNTSNQKLPSLNISGLPTKAPYPESSQVTSVYPIVETTNIKYTLPNYSSNNYTSYQTTSNYVPKTLEEIYNSINIKDANISKFNNNNINNSPLPSSPTYQTNPVPTLNRPSLSDHKKNLQLSQPKQSIPALSSGTKTPGSVIPWEEVDKYIEISKKLYQ